MGLVGALKDVVSDLGPDLTQLVFAGDKFVSASDFNVRVDSLLAASAAASSVFAKADISIAKNALPVLAIASLSQATVVAPAKPRRPAWNNAFAKNRYVEISQELE